MLTPVQYLQNMLEKAAIHQKKEKFSDRLLKHSAFNVQVSNKPVVSTQQQLGSMEAGASGPLTNGPITQSKPLTQTLTQKPLESTGTNQVHDASSNPVRSSTPPKPPTPATTTKIPNVLKVARDTGLADVDGKPYINTEDVALLGKLGFEIDTAEYSGLEKSGEVLDLYSYLEKYAEVPKSVSSAVDKGEAFSGSFLKDMGYSVPKGYEIKGDLCCPVEKTALLEKESAEKTAVAAWQRSEGKNPEGGLNAKGRASYKRETGGTLKAPVGESTPKGDRAKRQHSFCSRMCGMKSKNTGSKGQSDPDSRINKSLRKWNCKCGEDHDSLFEKVACLVKESKGRCWEGYKPVPGKEPYSNDSCEPVGAKKKKKSELDKEAAKKIPSNQPLLPGMDQWVKKQPFNHAEHLYSKGVIPKGHRDRWVSGALADDLRPKFDKVLETIRNTPSAM